MQVQGSPSGNVIEALPELVSDIPEARAQAYVAPPQLSDAALVNAIRARNGIAYIGFKPATAAPTSQTGVFPAMTRAAALDARRQVERSECESSSRCAVWQL